MTIPMHELSERAQKLARDPIGRGFVVVARPHGRGHRLKLVFNAEERDWLERRGWQVVEGEQPAGRAGGEREA